MQRVDYWGQRRCGDMDPQPPHGDTGAVNMTIGHVDALREDGLGSLELISFSLRCLRIFFGIIIYGS